MLGAVIIGVALLVSVLGYLVMPDATPDANDGAVQAQKLPPGSSVRFLKIRKNVHVEQKSLVHKMLFGQESAYMLVPIDSVIVDGMTVRAELFGKKHYWESYNLLDVVLPLYIGSTGSILADSASGDAGLSAHQIQYRSIDGAQATIKYQALVSRFHSQNIETRRYWLGTDRAGRDLLSRLMYGTRISLAIGIMAVLISMSLGFAIGAAGGFFGGWIDALVMWLLSVIWSVPGIMLVIAISMALQSRGVWVAFVAVGLTMWVEVARVVRGQIMAMKEKLFVEAARAFGVSNFQIVYVHILPNILGSLIVVATANFAAAILLEAGLSFLGLSVQPPTPSWGIMVNEGFQAIGTRNSWHLVLFPAMSICIIVLSFNLLGNGLRDAYDPKTLLR
jgi:peptide/nickel transport system permease protein